jgi:hypothetical protein
VDQCRPRPTVVFWQTMKAIRRQPVAAAGAMETFTAMFRKTLSRRELLAGSAAAGAVRPLAARDQKMPGALDPAK